MDIKQLTEQFKTYEELQLFCSSQFKQILTLSKKIKELEDKNIELSKKAKESTALSLVQPFGIATVGMNPSIIVQGDAKTIAQVQLKMLKDKAFDNELSLDETKRVEIFNKILNIQEDEPKTIKATAKTINTDELLSLVEIEDGTKGK